MKNKRIEICGGIASGKTTLALLLGKHGARVVQEDFRSNPFWEDFYKDIKKYSFETEISFFLQHYHQIKIELDCQLPIACDFSLFLDRAYANVTLPESHRRVFLEVYEEAITHIPPPILLVNLICAPDIELSRIRQRARSVEQGITTDYLTMLNNALDKEIDAIKDKVKVFEIDSGTHDFANDGKVRESLAKRISKQIK